MLKWIALILMLVDHFAYIMVDVISQDAYLIMRVLGRLSFPVFVYYVVLGVGRTSKLKTYLARLLLFALLSELVIRTLGLFSHSYVNIIFSLLLYAVIYVVFENKFDKVNLSETMRLAIIILLLALLPYVEYGYSGFFVFASLYFVHKKIPKEKQYLYAGILITLSFVPEMLMSNGTQIQWVAGFAGLFMFNKNFDKRILSPKLEKWTFYWAYPLQWLLFSAIYIYM